MTTPPTTTTATTSAPSSTAASASAGVTGSVELSVLPQHTSAHEGQAGGGAVDIRGLSVTYREDLPPVLRGLSIHIWGGCKAGIVGRTGSGE